MNPLSTQLAFWGVTVHLVIDWLFQNEWMAVNKANLRHPAGWVHAGLHFVGLTFVFPVQWALFIAAIHLLVDTRKPLIWWRKTYRQTVAGAAALHVAMWGDQVVHWAVICLVALWVGRV